jgi:hypothetical protein
VRACWWWAKGSSSGSKRPMAMLLYRRNRWLVFCVGVLYFLGVAIRTSIATAGKTTLPNVSPYEIDCLKDLYYATDGPNWRYENGKRLVAHVILVCMAQIQGHRIWVSLEFLTAGSESMLRTVARSCVLVRMLSRTTDISSYQCPDVFVCICGRIKHRRGPQRRVSVRRI